MKYLENQLEELPKYQYLHELLTELKTDRDETNKSQNDTSIESI